MGVLQGITAFQFGDGAGGKAALSLKTAVLRILADDNFTYMTASIRFPEELRKNGTVSYYVPELIQTEDYGDGTKAFQVPQSGLRTVNIDTREDAKWEWETFDVSRLNEMGYLLGMISSGLAMAIQATLNANFYNYLLQAFKGSMKTQILTLKYITKEDPDMTRENARSDYNRIRYKLNKISQMYDKAKLGIKKSEVMCVFSPNLEVGISNAFWDAPNSTGEYPVEKTLVGKKLGSIHYVVEKMLETHIPAGTSFSKDKDFDFTKLKGVILHNEAVAMPFNMESATQVINPDNANPRWIVKYQYGIGFLRPELVWAIQDETDPITPLAEIKEAIEAKEKEAKKAEKEAKKGA